MKIIIYSLFAVIVGLSSCSSKSNSSRKPVTNIIISPSNKVVTIGNDFTIEVESKTLLKDIDYIELYLNDKQIHKSTETSFSISLSTKTMLPGEYIVKTFAKNKNGLSGVNYSSIKVFSDILPKHLSFELIGSLKHNPKNFTQGLEFHMGILYEGTGDYGTSFIYEYNEDKTTINKSLKIDNQYFGEGITVLNNKIYQLTYKSKIGFIYDLYSFEKTGEFNFSSKEGWGLTNDGTYLIMSDGTSFINYIDPSDFSIKKSIQVTYNEGFINNINELEYVNGYIFANVWTTNTIIKLEAQTGKVIAIYDLSTLKKIVENESIDVLNGIAYHPKEKLFYVTGKLWPKIFKIKLLE